MTDTPQEQQPREPGVRYRRETRWRQVTTVIDGVPSTHEEPYVVEVPVPPKDWETLVERALAAWAAVLVIVAFIGTSASVGGLLDELLPAGVAYTLGLVFTGSWLGLLGLEWLDGRIDPDRATPARVAGWIALLIGMGAVFVYGHSNGLPWVGAAGACVDLSAKGFCTLLLRRYQVHLPLGVATWVRRQEQNEAGRALLADRVRRLDRLSAYRRAVGGREHQAAQAILSATTPTPALPDTSGQPSPAAPGQTTTPVSGPVPAPAVPVSGPVPPPPAPAPQAAPVPPPAAPQPPAPPTPPAGQTTSTTGPQTAAPASLQPVGPMSIAAAVRQARTEDPDQSDTDMVARVLELRGGDDGGQPAKFAETVTRTRRRQEAKNRKTS